MRNWASEIRIGLIAGVSAGAVLLAAPQISRIVRGGSAESGAAQASWTPPLVDPVQAASAALARGDSTFIAIAVDDALEFPGLTPTAREAASEEAMRLYSPASTGLRGARWDAFVPKVVPYAAAYNAVVQVARTTAKTRS